MYNLNYFELFILNTIAFFDLFDYPLTSAEIHKFFFTGGMEGGQYSIAEIEQELAENDKLKKIISSKNGFYFLAGREKIIEKRLAYYVLAEKKLKLSAKAIKIFRFLPFVKLVAICNNLAYRNAGPQSDIDFFVIVKKGRIWQARFYLILIIALLGLRPSKAKVKDKICLSFFATEESLDMSKIKISGEDIYLVFWLATLRPVYERDDFLARLLEENLWLKKYLPNWQPPKTSFRYRVEDNKINKIFYNLGEFVWGGFLGNWREKLAKHLQLKLMSQRKKDLAVAGDTRVIISDSVLKFHENDRRIDYQQKFEKKRQELINQL